MLDISLCRLVWEHRVSVIVVLTPVREERESFWPREGGSEHYSLVDSGCWLSNALTVTTEGEEALGGVAEAVIRHVTLESSVDGDSDHVTLFHYHGWPQHGEGKTQCSGNILLAVLWLLLMRGDVRGLRSIEMMLRVCKLITGSSTESKSKPMSHVLCVSTRGCFGFREWRGFQRWSPINHRAVVLQVSQRAPVMWPGSSTRCCRHASARLSAR